MPHLGFPQLVRRKTDRCSDGIKSLKKKWSSSHMWAFDALEVYAVSPIFSNYPLLNFLNIQHSFILIFLKGIKQVAESSATTLDGKVQISQLKAIWIALGWCGLCNYSNKTFE